MATCNFTRVLEHLAAAPHPPRADAEGQPPWHDPAFSERMLTIHLDDTTHMASRAGWVIQSHVDWLEERLADGEAADSATTAPASRQSRRVLDLACGPGLYCHELARRGWPSVGVDFAPAALEHARRVAAEEKLACTFLAADLMALSADFATQVGAVAAVTFWSGEFHALAREAAGGLLAAAAACLPAGGLFVLEYQPWDSFPQTNDQAWEVCDHSPFYDGRQLWLQEWAWDDGARAMVDVHWVLTAESDRPERYVQRHFAYHESELDAVLDSAGLRVIERHPPLTGCDPNFEFPVIVAVKT